MSLRHRALRGNSSIRRWDVNIPVALVPLRDVQMYALKVKALLFWLCCAWVFVNVNVNADDVSVDVFYCELFRVGWLTDDVRVFLLLFKTSPKFRTFGKLILNLNTSAIEIIVIFFQLDSQFHGIKLINSSQNQFKQKRKRRNAVSKCHTLFVVHKFETGWNNFGILWSHWIPLHVCDDRIWERQQIS